MANVFLNHIYKVYPNGTKAVNDFTMEIKDKEFIIFVGPSGCGKSTTLRMIAGLEDITTGQLFIDGNVMNDIDPKDRDIAMVFQNYALYPHMTVYDNMAFGLKLRKMSKEDIDVRVKEAAEILGITDYLTKKPGEMSGGQRQRVALGRAIVREPKVFLLDEPLSNLDAKLRNQMRSEILKLHQKLQTTFIYVTHDQVEAMTMGTRIVVMKDGFVQQIDTPRNLYNFPCNKFVAGFIGTPQMNFFNGILKRDGNKVEITFEDTDVKLSAPAEYFTRVNPVYLNGTKTVIVGIRAEHISSNPNQFPCKASCVVSHYEDLGTECQVYGDFSQENAEARESNTRVVLKAPAGSEFVHGQNLEVSIDVSHLHLFDPETENSISLRIPATITLEGRVERNLSLLGAIITLPKAMPLDRGKFELTIPIDAISVDTAEKDEAVKAVCKSVELINGVKLLKLEAKNTIFYAVKDRDCTISAGSEVYVNFDLKRIRCRNTETENVVEALEMQNELVGQLAKRKVVEKITNEEDGKVKTNKGIEIDLLINEFAITSSDELAIKLISSDAKKGLFERKMAFRFSPYAATLSEEGISAEVEKIVDYGNEKFAQLKVGEEHIYVLVNGDDPEGTVHFTIDPDKLSVYDTERGITIC